MVERFHRCLKAALKGHDHWADVFPLVLLGIRMSLKEDIGCTAAELVYGTTLHLPGGFFLPQPADSSSDPRSYVVSLQNRMQVLQATLPRPVSHTSTPINDTLKDASHVFIRHDAIRKPLQPPYDGPYKVLDRAAKYFTIDLKGRRDTVSVDRLKPAHLDTAGNSPAAVAPPTPQTTPCPQDPAPPPAPSTSQEPLSSRDQVPLPTRTTRSGRQVHWPTRLDDYAH